MIINFLQNIRPYLLRYNAVAVVTIVLSLSYYHIIKSHDNH